MARPLVDVDVGVIKRMAQNSIQVDEIQYVLGLSDNEIAPYLHHIYDAWPNDKVFIKTRLSRLRKSGLGFSAKIKENIKQCISNQIAAMVMREMGSIESLIGCEIEDLMLSLQSKFKDGMSWDNHGSWHIDHIVPRSKFTAKQIKECFHLDNLQPLWAKDNLKKGNRV